jgi:hypothetical protein
MRTMRLLGWIKACALFGLAFQQPIRVQAFKHFKRGRFAQMSGSVHEYIGQMMEIRSYEYRMFDEISEPLKTSIYQGLDYIGWLEMKMQIQNPIAAHEIE